MKNQKITLFFLLIIILSFSATAYLTNLNVIYQNETTKGNNIYYDKLTDQIIRLDITTQKNFTYISKLGVTQATRNYYAGNNYGIFTIGNRHYYTRFNTGASGYVSSINSSYSNNSINFEIAVVSDSPSFKGISKIGNLIYEFRGTGSARLNVWNVTNNTKIFYDNSLPDLSYTDCNIVDSDRLAIVGYDYDDDKLILYCPNTSKFVYIKENYYLTKNVYNSDTPIEILNYILPATYTTQLSHQTNYRFVKVDDVYYMVNGTNTSQILSSLNVDIYEGLVCNNLKTICYQENSMCLPNNEIYTGVNSSNYLCEKTSLTGTEIYCNIDNITYCAGGCVNNDYTNIYGVNYVKGTCYASSTCTNDCNVEGLSYSDTPNTYKTCGFYDSDACLDWSNSIPCIDGKYSFNGYCYDYNTSGVTYYTLDSFKVTPDLNIATSYDLNTLTPKASYTSNNNFLNIGLDYSATPTSFYTNKICNYTTSSILNKKVKYDINTSEQNTIIGFSNGETKINFKGKSIKVIGSDSSNKTIFEYNVTHNDTNGVCIYDNSSLLGCVSIDYEDIKNFDFTIKKIRQQTKQLHSTRLIINNNQGGFKDIYTGNRIPFTDLVGNYYYLTIISDNVTINTLDVYNEIQLYEAWKNTTWTQYDDKGVIKYQQTCTFKSVGCRTIRSYYTNDLNKGLWNYKDWDICVNALGSQKLSDDGNTIFTGLNKQTKIIMGFIIPFIIMMILVITGFIQQDDTTKKTFIYSGVFLFFGGIILFSILGWIPVWIIIVTSLISSAVIGFGFVSKSQGG